MITITDKDKQLFKDNIQSLKAQKGQLLPVLLIAQDMFGYIPIEIEEIIQEELHLSNAHIHGVLTFYEQLRTTPIGKHLIGVCSGTSCHIQKSKEINTTLEHLLGVRIGETTKDGLFTIIPVKCLGLCDTAPNISVDETMFTHVTISDVQTIIAKYK